MRSKPSFGNEDFNTIAKAAVDIKKAIKQIKAIMKQVASTRDILGDGDIDISVLFPSKDSKSPPTYEDGKPVYDTNTTTLPRHPPGSSRSGTPPFSKRNSDGPKMSPATAHPSLEAAMQTFVKPGMAASPNPKQPPLRECPRSPAPSAKPESDTGSVVSLSQDLPGLSREKDADIPPTIVKEEEKLEAASTSILARYLAGLGGRVSRESSRPRETSGYSSEKEITQFIQSNFGKYRSGHVSRCTIRREGSSIILGPATLGRLERVAETLRWWPSKDAMCQTLASATEEQLRSLAVLLRHHDDDGEPVDRNLLRIVELGTSSSLLRNRAVPNGDSKKSVALLAVVEDVTRGDSTRGSWSPVAQVLDGQRSSRGLPTSGAGPLKSRIQDISGPSGHPLDLGRSLTTVHVWRIQPVTKTPSLGVSKVPQRLDWVRCLALEEPMDQQEVLRWSDELDPETRRRGPLEQYSDISDNQIAQIAKLQQSLNAEETRLNYTWLVQKVHVIRADKPPGLLRFLGSKRGGEREISALLVFFTCEPRQVPPFITNQQPLRGDQGGTVPQPPPAVTVMGDGGGVRSAGIPRERTTYTRLSRRYLSIETLNAFGIDFDLDQNDPAYVVVKRWVPEEERDQLWRHTRLIRERRMGSGPTKVALTVEGDHHHHYNQKKDKRDFIFVKKERRRSRAASLLKYLRGEGDRERKEAEENSTSLGDTSIESPESQKQVEMVDEDKVETSYEVGGGGGDDDDDDDEDDHVVARLLAHWTPAGASRRDEEERDAAKPTEAASPNDG